MQAAHANLMTAWRPVLRLGRIPAAIRPSSTSVGRFEPDDFVILRCGDFKGTPPVFLGPLVSGRSHRELRGKILHDEIIGKNVRDTVKLHQNRQSGYTTYRVHEVKLEEYVVLSKRIVTPIYPHDANLIVSLLDLHPEPYDTNREGSLQINVLEAGTGHGSLTLYLSRAIHAANSPAPRKGDYDDISSFTNALNAWKKTRSAVINTIDNVQIHSVHAKRTVGGFRRGQYYGNVDFHIGDVSRWIDTRLEEHAGEAFLTHAFLDLPNTQDHLALTASALKTDGALMVFCPSITQIIECVRDIRKDEIPLELDRVVELGVNGGTGGRLWDVRLVKPRPPVVKQPDPSHAERSYAEGPVSYNEVSSAHGESFDSSISRSVTEDDLVMICRPKVGDRITGGGFLALFKKMKPRPEPRAA